MPTDTEIWARACERVGLWKHVDMIRREDDDGYGIERPAPAIGDPTAVVAMFEYLIPRLEPEYWYELALEVRRRGTSLALANAVLAVPQETQP